MLQSRKRLYAWLLGTCAAGYGWLAYNMLVQHTSVSGKVTCLFKQVTHLPCPSCGVTRSVEHLLHGEFSKAIGINPLGLIVAAIMLAVPVWVIYDLITRRNSLFLCYQRMEIQIRKPGLALPLVLLILANWAWNISKGL